MKAKITADAGYTCAPDGNNVVTFAKGTLVDGDVGRWAVEEGCAQPTETAPSAPNSKPQASPPGKTGSAAGGPTWAGKAQGASPENKGKN